jgi:hypothetical protein
MCGRITQKSPPDQLGLTIIMGTPDDPRVLKARETEWVPRYNGARQGKAALRDCHAGPSALRRGGHLGELEALRHARLGTHVCRDHLSSQRDGGGHPRPHACYLTCRGYDRWLSCVEPDPRDLLVPFAADRMTIWPISTRVNAVANDDADLLAPFDQ